MLLGCRSLSTEHPRPWRGIARPTYSDSGRGANAGPVATSSRLVEIANAIVHLYKDAFGRGPTKARARFAGSDLLVVLLQDNLTVVERNLLAGGEHARVSEQRLLLQLAFEDQKRSEVERILQRHIVASVSGIDPGRDLIAEIFTLEPSGETAPGSSGSAPGRPSNE